MYLSVLCINVLEYLFNGSVQKKHIAIVIVGFIVYKKKKRTVFICELLFFFSVNFMHINLLYTYSTSAYCGS